ncbi:MAG: hypothetical protein ACRD8W_23145 [Nitrososphaeraceae archaeon]
MKRQIPLCDLFKAMTDRNSTDLFDNIAINDLDSHELIGALVLSKRQYYDRIYDLRAAGLIETRKGRYDITSFGRIFYSLIKVIRKASERYWRLQARDILKFSTISDDEYNKIIDILLDDIEIKQILFEGFPTASTFLKSDPILQPDEDNQPMFAIIFEDKGGPDDVEDEYNRRDPEADSDEFLVNSGATNSRSLIA